MNFYGPIQDDSVIASIHDGTSSTTSFYFAGALSQVVTVANANTGADSIEVSNSNVFTKPSSIQYPLFPKNRRFVGRGDELQELHQGLLIDEECQKIAVFGLGELARRKLHSTSRSSQ